MRLSLLAAVIVLSSNLASAGSDTASALVNEKLVRPLVAKEANQGKFSRARPVPAERRVRIVDDKPQTDAAGNAFFTFALDERHGWSDDKDESSWNKATMTGCVYVDRKEVFIKRGKAFHPAAAALGKKTKAAPEATCRAVTAVSAR